MERNVRYQILNSDDDIPSDSGATGATATAMPTSNFGASSQGCAAEGETMPPPPPPPPPPSPPEYGEAPKGAYMPPDYSVATDLPSYEEVQRLKMEEEQRRQDDVNTDPESLCQEDGLLGTDFIFFCSFFVAFLFNWIGFLLLMCFCHTIAGRYGALAGFGLSLAKWTLIVKHSTDLISSDNSWLWWLILAFGVLICVRAILQYIHVKREWRLLSRAAQERLVYFY